MILVDTGPLIALLDASDSNHTRCVEIARRLPAVALLTTWPCFTEAMYLLGEVGGYRYQAKLWELQLIGHLVLHSFRDFEIIQMKELMEKYQDVPMDLADASLMAVAESFSVKSLFTLDSDFFVYRLRGGAVLEIIR